MNKIYQLLNKIPDDKWKHFGACFVIALFFALVSKAISMTGWQTLFCGFSVALSAGLGKEYADYVNPNNYWDWYDVLADLVGAFLGTIFIAIL